MKLKLLPFFLMVFVISSAQERNFKFGKVSIEEVMQKEHSLEKDAEAAILHKKERVYYDYVKDEGFRTKRFAYYRIKVYNKSGLDWGTMEVPLYTPDNDGESMSAIKGYTYNLVGGKLSKVKLKKEGIFKEKVNKYRSKVSIVMPEVKEGSVIEIEYQIASDFIGNIDEFKFQYGIPVDNVDVSVEIPEYFIFKRYGRGFYPIDLRQSKKNRKIDVVYQTENNDRLIGSTSRKSRIGNMAFVENVYKVHTSNIPSLKEVDFTDNIDNYRSAVKFELASTRFPNSPYKDYSVSWEDVARSIYKLDDFGVELQKTRLVKEIVDALKAESKTETELIQTIYDYVKNNITWNEYYGVLCENGIKKTLTEKTGNSADVNLTLTAMLKYAGYSADPVLVSTKSHGVPLFPTREGFNYVLTAVDTENGMILLDATEKEGAMGILPVRVMNWNGRLIKEDGTSKEISLLPNTPAKHIVTINANILQDGTVEGKMRTQLTQNRAYNYRKAHKNDTWEDIMMAIEDRFLEMEIDELEVKNEKVSAKPLIESCSFVKENQVEIISGKLYFKPALFMAMTENPFKMDKREYPVDFGYPILNKVTINYKIPDGYQVESVPENIALGLPDAMGSFKYSVRQNGNQLQFSCALKINRAIIPAQYYQALKEFYAQVVVKQTENVVLVKAELIK